jgi:hypothetical protein
MHLTWNLVDLNDVTTIGAWIIHGWQLVGQKGGRGRDFTWCSWFPYGHNQLWKHWDAMMGEVCECFHSKRASMVSSLLADVVMWCNMLYECHCAIGQTPSWYKGETATIHNIYQCNMVC